MIEPKTNIFYMVKSGSIRSLQMVLNRVGLDCWIRPLQMILDWVGLDR